MNKADLLKDLRLGWHEWKETVSLVPQPELDVPGVIGPWTMKDTVAHVVFWLRSESTQVISAFERREPASEESVGRRQFTDEWNTDIPLERRQELIIEASKPFSLDELMNEGESLLQRWADWLDDRTQEELETSIGWWLGPPHGSRPPGHMRLLARATEEAVLGELTVWGWAEAIRDHTAQHGREARDWLTSRP